MKKTFLLIFLALAWGCKQKETPSAPVEEVSASSIRYAQGFTIRDNGNIKEVEVVYPFQGATSGFRYWLVPKDVVVPAHDADVKVIRVPLASIACTSTSHIPLLDYLGETDKLTGFSTTDLISSEKMRARVDAGKVQELGIDKGINLERLAVLKPDLLMGYALSSDYAQFKKMEELGVPVVLNGEYLEKHPLGRAEWIKFMALFFDKEKEADSVFSAIEKNYLDTKALAEKATTHPTILSGIVYGDAWFLPGGQNYASRILKDAGCHYLWADDSSHGFLELGFEAVYLKAHNADFWLGVGSFRTLEDIKNADQRYTKFKPYSEKTVYNFDARVGAKGGSEYLELGYLRPDIILKDLVKIAHPELVPDYTLYFHRKLE